MDNENPTPCFPDEIIVEILSRLPVKSLLKFRSVSKSWLSLLSNPYFIKTQINLDVKNVNHRLAVIASVPGLGKVCSVYSLLYEKSSCKIPQVGSAVSEKDPRLVKTVLNVTNLDYPFKPPLGSARVVGSCNGLICLTTVSYNLMLWNPSTGKYKEFPESFVQGGVGCFIRYGFGYDASNDDYKVVKILSFPKNEGKHENVVNVYSSKANSWRMIQGFDSGYINGLLGVFVNGTGTLHWDVCDSSGSWEIMTFDLVTERFGKMGFPSCGNEEFSWMLSVSGGRLVGCYNYYPYRTDVWVMKEYSVQDSWTKLVSLSCPVDRRGYISPLFVSENADEVLVKLGTEISVYNSRNGSYESVKVLSSGGRVHVQAVAYIESLASPDVISN